jgi:hypothetical protein
VGGKESCTNVKASLNTADVTPFSLVNGYRFGEMFYLHFEGFVRIFQSTLQHISAEGHFVLNITQDTEIF